jgi:hypothetical protein
MIGLKRKLYLAAACFAVASVAVSSSFGSSSLATEYVFLVTADGLRPQELFRGMDPLMAEEANLSKSGIESLQMLRDRYWASGPDERRKKLMPFFWGELAPGGVVLGNRSRGSRVHIRNPHRISYPGYAEILNGQPLETIDSNSSVFSPRETLPEFLRRRFSLPPAGAAVFASWSVFNWITMQTDGSIYCSAGYEEVAPELLSPGMEVFNRLQFSSPTPWDTVRHDSMTLGLALEFIETHQPKFFFLSLGEMDDWAHEPRYDRYLETIRLFDDALRELWALLQSMETYRGKSTVIVTTDHGRGKSLVDWPSHGGNVPGSDETWLAVFGPDTPARGEIANAPDYSQSHIASTILAFYGLDYRDFNPKAAPPIAEALKNAGSEPR